MFDQFLLHEFISAFVVLFAIIDMPGSIPIVLNLRRRGKIIRAGKTALLSLTMFIIFFYIGEAFLSLFGVDISSFAVAGSLIIFIMALEMILDIEIFKENNDTPKDCSFFPMVFPLIAGAGSLTTMLSIRAQYASINILGAIIANVIVIFTVLKITKHLEKLLGAGGIYMLRKFFGIILLAISIKLFTTNITIMIDHIIKLES